MACNKPQALRRMVSDSRGMSPPLITSNKDAEHETEVLYNRIDQQVELISVLKQRLDETSARWERSEREQEEQESERNKIQLTYNELLQKYSLLELRFSQLSENHREMIKLKDEYKSQIQKSSAQVKASESAESMALKVEKRKNSDLQEEIKKLRDEREDSADLYKVLQKKSEGQEGCINDMELKNASLQKQLNTDKEDSAYTVAQLKNKLVEKDEAIEKSHKQCQSLQSHTSDLTQQILARGKLVNDKEDTIKGLHKEREKKKEEYNKVQAEYAALKDSVDSNRIVRDLRETLIDQKDAYSRLEMELSRFKKIAQDTLKREQSVNQELRHVSSASTRKLSINQNTVLPPL